MGCAMSDLAARPEQTLLPFVTRHLVRPIALLLVEFAAYGAAAAGAVLAEALCRRRADIDAGDHRA
jgi:hypothetical protein